VRKGHKFLVIPPNSIFLYFLFGTVLPVYFFPMSFFLTSDFPPSTPSYFYIFCPFVLPVYFSPMLSFLTSDFHLYSLIIFFLLSLSSFFFRFLSFSFHFPSSSFAIGLLFTVIHCPFLFCFYLFRSTYRPYFLSSFFFC
jgi:hypothetical protein